MKNNKLFATIGLINYLLVVFLNAFTDLGHKILIQNTLFKVYDAQELIVLTTILNALILLPFIFMFSPSGFLADRFAKHTIMKYSSILAIIITLIITLSYYMGWFYVAFTMTFILALQSAIYSPAKYGYIKELVGDKLISSANGAVQAVTTVAILGGILFYTILFESSVGDDFCSTTEILQVIAPIGWLLVLGSVIEWYLASKLPNRSTPNNKTFRFKKYINGYYLFKNLKTIRRKEEIFDAIIALSLFWSISQVILAIFGEYAKTNLGITNTIAIQGVMALAGVGMVIGSILSAKFSKYYINMGLTLFGAIGITVAVFMLPHVESMIIIAMLFTLFGIFSGFIMVALNAQIQFLSPRVHLGVILAGNNFIQNIFMVSFLLITTIFAYFGMNSKLLIYMMAIVGLSLIVKLFKRYFIMTFWTTMELILRTRHNYTYRGLENISKTNAVLLLGNHVSWIDWVILQLPLNKQINFMMNRDIYYWKSMHYIFKKGEAIPVSKRRAKDALKEAGERLKQSKIVALFPEGGLSDNGETKKFFRGFELIPKDYDGMIVPFYIEGLFGSIFAKHKGKERKSIFKKREITIHFGEPISKDTSADDLRDIVIKMRTLSSEIS